MIGIQAPEKDLTAKMIETVALPLLRLDIGALFGSLVGESEERSRRALELVRLIAPVSFGLMNWKSARSRQLGFREPVPVFSVRFDLDARKEITGFGRDGVIFSTLPPELLRRGQF